MNSADYDVKTTPSGIPPAGGKSAGPGEVQRTLELGQQVLGFVADLADVARMEAMLAAKLMPRVILLWLAMVPIILLAWCSFTACIAWVAYALTDLAAVGLFIFFVQQLLLLLICHLLQKKYKARMVMPCTRSHLNNFLKGFSNEPGDQIGDKKL